MCAWLRLVANTIEDGLRSRLGVCIKSFSWNKNTFNKDKVLIELNEKQKQQKQSTDQRFHKSVIRFCCILFDRIAEKQTMAFIN